jgi:lipoprotein-anchoring transpeptidase ErfK/SrfK
MRPQPRAYPPQSAQRPLPPRRAKRRLPLPAWMIAGGVAGFGGLMLLAAALTVGVLLLSPARVSVPVEGMDEGDLRQVVADIAARPLTLTDAERQWAMQMAELGAAVDVETTLNRVLNAERGETVTPQVTIDLAQAQTALLNISYVANIAALPGEDGRALEIPVTLDRLRANPAGELVDGTLELDMMPVAAPEEAPTNNYTGEMTTHVVGAGQELGLIARQYNVSMADIVSLNALTNPDLLFVGQELRIPAAGVYTPTAADAPPAPTSQGRAILVSTGEQRVYAYENGQMVRSHLVSTGRAETPTVLGDYNVYIKLQADDMSGPDYFLPQVPYTMYFYQGYAIHGTYWHNSFGRPMSHGCVNLPVDEARWWFDFASVGTPVRVI